MTSPNSVYDGLWAQIRQGTEAESVAVALQSLNDVCADGLISSDQVHDLRLAGFRVMKSVTLDDAGTALKFVTALMLPVCLRYGDRASDETVEQDSQSAAYRRQLSEWINQYAEEPRIVLRDHILDAVLPALD